MRLRRAAVTVAVLPCLLFFACKNGGGGPKATETSDPSPTPEGTTVASDDGKLSLVIPNGAMPAGTDVSISSVAHDGLPVELSQLAGSGDGYQLEPDGLTFSQPVTATLTIDRSELADADGEQTAYALASFNATAGREVLDSETTWDGGNTITVSSQIGHFSYLSRTKGSLHVGVRNLERRRQVGQTYELEAFVAPLNEDVIEFKNVAATWLASSPIALQSAADVTIAHISFSSVDPNTQATFVCERPGTGSNGINVR
ncbi:MAG: hypothetical protein ACREMY_26160, partial [bacterium]